MKDQHFTTKQHLAIDLLHHDEREISQVHKRSSGELGSEARSIRTFVHSHALAEDVSKHK